MANTKTAVQAQVIGIPKKRPGEKGSFVKRYGLIIGSIALIVVNFLPTPAGLPVAGKRMMAILLFAVIVWITDSISYPSSAAVILGYSVQPIGALPEGITLL